MLRLRLMVQSYFLEKTGITYFEKYLHLITISETFMERTKDKSNAEIMIGCFLYHLFTSKVRKFEQFDVQGFWYNSFANYEGAI